MSLWIVGVFHVAVGRVGGKILTGFAFLLHNSFDLFTAVLDIELVDDIQERSKIVVLLIGAVHAAVHGDETDIVFGEKHFRVETDFQIVSANTAHVLGDDDTDLIVLNQLNHSFPIWSVEVGTGVTIVHEKLDVSETLFLCVFFENRLLIDNAVALSCEFVITTESTVDRSNFVRLPIHVLFLLNRRAVCQHRIACSNYITRLQACLLCHSSSTSFAMWLSNLPERLRVPS